ncbi:ETC complex I subunit conserved region-domain-containing protein [Chytridium lagenaria]|nr:ETC complex I subunit conserved region-domain-containing protein [Chytridium lagenaria]
MFSSRVLRQVVKLKETTGIYGIPVHPNPRPELISLYHKLLSNVDRIPAHSVYRKSVEAMTKHRLQIVEAEESVSKIEAKIDNGQIEELIKQAEDEINLLNALQRAKAWEPLRRLFLRDSGRVLLFNFLHIQI